jgi:NADPH:quinone reductase-like Zn-dependent oxidoreductase
MFEAMNRAIEANNIKPVVDKVHLTLSWSGTRRADRANKQVFKWEETVEAYQYLDSGKHFGKVCIEL